MNTLELQIQNKIIMYARPLYPFTGEIKGLCVWYDDEICFHKENKYQWTLEAIRLRKDIKRDFYTRVDIAGNFL
tara:strand:+ start:1792 stop:2013 length:222 start_codon:yes stop_codon:yes gene_type:complete